MNPPVLFNNARVFDGQSVDCAEGMQVLVADAKIQDVSAQRVVPPAGARVIDAAGRTLMPGPIEADGQRLSVIVRGGELAKCRDAAL